MGTGFKTPHRSELLCLIGSSTPVVARWETTKTVTCDTQSTRQVGPVPITLRLRDLQNATHLQLQETTLKTAASLVFIRRPHVEALAPMRGPVRGGSKVTIGGTALPTGLGDRCFFGSVQTIPALRSSSNYECFTPPAPTSMLVQVTINQDTSADPLFYRTCSSNVVYSITAILPPASRHAYDCRVM